MYREIATHVRDIGSAGLGLLAELVFPPTCAGCDAVGNWLCEMCAERLALLDRQRLPDADTRDVGIEFALWARYSYAEPVRRAVHLLKYEGQRARAEWFAEQLEPLVVELRHAKAMFEPVPLTSRRERKRGYNQSREIAQRLAERTRIPVGNDIRRIRETRPQVELDGHERILNVRGAFDAHASVAGKHIILVDDVITTGATMRECAAACFEAGAASVVGIAAAIGQQ